MHAVLFHDVSVDISQPLQNLISAYFHTMPLNELIDSKDRSRRQEQLIYELVSGAECSVCFSRDTTFERFRTQALPFEDREAIAYLLFSQLLAIPISSQLFFRVSGEARGKLYCSVVEILQQAMCMHDAEKIILAARDIQRNQRGTR